MEFSQKLKLLMQERKLSAYKMANDLHCSQTTIRNWLDGKTMPQPRAVIQLCEYFDISELELMGGIPEQKKNPSAEYSAEEKELLDNIRAMPVSMRSRLLSISRLYLTADSKSKETE